MKHDLNSVSLQIRLFLLTVLLTVAGFALVSHYSGTTYALDTSRVSVTSGQEFNSDSKSPLESPHASDALIFGLLLVLANTFIVRPLRIKSAIPQLSFLYHIRPRSPPSL